MIEFEEQPLSQEGPTSSGSVLSSFREFSSGAGVNVAKLNAEGFFIGGSDFSSAPFSVDFTGHVIATSAEFPADATKLDATGGAYNTAASGARVRILPDANTGLLIVDDAGAEVFKALIGGTDVGDVIIGNYASNKGLKWDKSAATFTVRGTLNADDITAGTLVGRTVKAKGTGSAADVWIDGTDGALKFYYGASQLGYIYASTSAEILFYSSNDLYIQSVDMFVVDSGSSVDLMADSFARITYNDNGGTDSFLVNSNGVNMMQLDSAGNLFTNGDIQCGDTFKSSDGSTGVTSSPGFVTAVESSRAKFRTLTIKDGLITNVGSESGWL